MWPVNRVVALPAGPGSVSTAVTETGLMAYKNFAGTEAVTVGTVARRVGDPLPGRGLHQLAQHDYQPMVSRDSRAPPAGEMPSRSGGRIDGLGRFHAVGVGVNQRGRQLRYGVGEGVLGFVREVVGLVEADGRVDVEFGIGVQAMSDPAQFHTTHCLDTRFCCQGGLGGVDDRRIYRVHESVEYVTGRGPKHGEDGDGDQ